MNIKTLKYIYKLLADDKSAKEAEYEASKALLENMVVFNENLDADAIAGGEEPFADDAITAAQQGVAANEKAYKAACHAINDFAHHEWR